jgi:hypothetical protein
MPAPRKLTDEQIDFARERISQRKRALALAAAYPTIEQLAAELDVTARYLSEVLSGRARAERAEQNAIESFTGNILT